MIAMIAWFSIFLLGALLSATVDTTEADSNPAKLIHYGTVASDIIGLTIDSGQKVQYGRQIPYIKQEGHKVDEKSHHHWVYQDGQFLGSLVGAKKQILHTPDRVIGRPLDITTAEKPANWQIKSQDDPNYANGLQPISIHRKSRPTDFARVGSWQYDAPIEHILYLKLPYPLQQSKHYALKHNADLFAPVEFIWKPENQRSEAVHVSHLGFRPDDPAKVAFLSCWMGNGGGLSYPDEMAFHVINDKSGKIAYKGLVALSKAADDMTEDAYKRNYNGTDVYEIDFTELQKPGTYRIYVEGVGCSYPFKIGGDVWEDAFKISARGFYHQRSGIVFEQPYTDFERPRPFHPDDGLKVYASTTALMDTANGLTKEGSNFGNLVKGRTNEMVRDAWGGYMDAGDWDRRIQHLEVSRLLLDLADIHPEYFSQLSLNIPESRDALPDIVNEALFNLDCYRRMQTPDGGIRGGIESSEHPRNGEASWQESLDVIAYAPGVWSSYLYAATAARAARWLKFNNPKTYAQYSESAIRAVKWAEDEFPKLKKEQPHAVNDARNLAAVEVWRLTGEDKWHDLYLKTTAFQNPKAETYLWQNHEQREAAWVYARSEDFDPEIGRNCVKAMIREADQYAEQCEKTGFRWTKNPWAPTAFGILSSPDGVSLVRGYILTGDNKYLRALVLACQTGAGANPMNICYTTGLGYKWPQHPLHIDSRITSQPPPPGLTVFGPVDTKRDDQAWAKKQVERFCYPPVKEWPTLEAYWDVFWYPIICEFTVHQPMARNAYIWGYLAARQ